MRPQVAKWLPDGRISPTTSMYEAQLRTTFWLVWLGCNDAEGDTSPTTTRRRSRRKGGQYSSMGQWGTVHSFHAATFIEESVPIAAPLAMALSRPPPEVGRRAGRVAAPSPTHTHQVFHPQKYTHQVQVLESPGRHDKRWRMVLGVHQEQGDRSANLEPSLWASSGAVPTKRFSS